MERSVEKLRGGGRWEGWGVGGGVGELKSAVRARNLTPELCRAVRKEVFDGICEQ